MPSQDKPRGVAALDGPRLELSPKKIIARDYGSHGIPKGTPFGRLKESSRWRLKSLSKRFWLLFSLQKSNEDFFESARENFLTKHCNIIYQGTGIESFIDIKDLQHCRVNKIDWTWRKVYVGVDLSMSAGDPAGQVANEA